VTTIQRPEIKTMANHEAAFAGETMAHIKYRYFSKLAREAGDEDTARTFEATADQEVSMPSATWTCSTPRPP